MFGQQEQVQVVVVHRGHGLTKREAVGMARAYRLVGWEVDVRPEVFNDRPTGLWSTECRFLP